MLFLINAALLILGLLLFGVSLSESKISRRWRENFRVIAASLVILAGFLSDDPPVGILTSVLVIMTGLLIWLTIMPLGRSARKNNVILALAYESGSLSIMNRGTLPARQLKILLNSDSAFSEDIHEIGPEKYLKITLKRAPQRVELRWTTDDDEVLSYGVWRNKNSVTFRNLRREGFFTLESSS